MDYKIILRDLFKFNTVWLLGFIHQIIFHDPTKDCIIKGKRENWLGLPKSKSLFGAKLDTGLPIGNLTSQLFGNIYLDDFDHFIKHKLNCKYYGRYVDDVVIVHQDKEYLKSIIPIIKKYLHDELSLEIHPKKIYLQDFRKGVSFLGVVFKPHRRYIRNRVKGNFYKKIKYWNKILIENKLEFNDKFQTEFVASMNSYLGMIGQFNTYKLRRKMLNECMSPDFQRFVHKSDDFNKIISNSYPQPPPTSFPIQKPLFF